MEPLPVDTPEPRKSGEKAPWKSYAIHLGLFIATLITTTFAGGEWMFGKFVILDDYQWGDFTAGFAFSLPFLAFLTCHEFGHYLTARRYNIKTTLPFYMPFWLGFLGIPGTIGTFGAIIRIKEKIKSRWQYFDVGIAGPLAGFVVALGILAYGFTHLPPPEYIFEIHPEYEQYGLDYQEEAYNSTDEDPTAAFVLGTNLVMEFFKEYVAPDPSLIPNKFEIAHYPWIFAGFLALFFTALNLLPIGQLDGGHITYGLFGQRAHQYLSVGFLILLVFYAGLGLVTPEHLNGLVKFNPENWYYAPLYFWFLSILFYRVFPHFRQRMMWVLAIFSGQLITVMLYKEAVGYPGWLLFAFLLGRIMGTQHPEPEDNKPLDQTRIILGWLAIIIFVLCFSPVPLEVVPLGQE